jgi:hypothetical protein
MAARVVVPPMIPRKYKWFSCPDFPLVFWHNTNTRKKWLVNTFLHRTKKNEQLLLQWMYIVFIVLYSGVYIVFT